MSVNVTSFIQSRFLSFRDFCYDTAMEATCQTPHQFRLNRRLNGRLNTHPRRFRKRCTAQHLIGHDRTRVRLEPVSFVRIRSRLATTVRFGRPTTGGMLVLKSISLKKHNFRDIPSYSQLSHTMFYFSREQGWVSPNDVPDSQNLLKALHLDQPCACLVWFHYEDV